MGRLTLNILLSFAQFEREIIGERIRDKIAAQKRKGKWAGGVPVLGASGSKRSIADDWEITYRFAASPNMSGLIVGNITGISKGGWEYLWVRYRDVEDTGAKMLVKQPVAVYVERVYESGNFGSLLIGT